MEPDVNNILAVYGRADDETVEAGMLWYPNANVFAQNLGGPYWHIAAGVIAALSPQVGWDRNMLLAERFYDRNGDIENIGTVGQHAQKAVRIFNGEDAMDVLGPKTRAFYANIIDPENPNNTPVIDRHAFDVAVGMVTDNVTRQRHLERKGGYDKWANSYREAAEITGLLSSQIQAITWVQWRKEVGQDWRG